jgi:hypothetical protein
MRATILLMLLFGALLNDFTAGLGAKAAETESADKQIETVTSSPLRGWHNVIVGRPEIVVHNQEMNPSGVPWLSSSARKSLDTDISTFKKGSDVYWLNSRGSGNYALFLGNVSHPFERPILAKPMFEIFGEKPPILPPDGTRAKYWIVNTYQDGEVLLAFVHVEHTDLIHNNIGKSEIGLAISKDYGISFRYIGDIISPEHGGPFNVQGAPYIIKDKYFYVYAKDICKPSDSNGFGGATIVARSGVEEVLAAARNGRVTKWSKYKDGGWSSPALGGECSGISINPEGIVHTDAAFSAFTNSYFLTLSMNTGHGRRNSWINLYESYDGLHWQFITAIVDQAAQSQSFGFQYVTIVNADGSDNGAVGRKFFVYSGGEAPGSGPMGVIYRWSVEIR